MTRNLITKESILRAQLATVTEAAVQAAIIGYLCVNRIPHSITDAKRVFNEKGQQVRRVKKSWPDITACYEGHFVAIEVKRPVNGRLSPGQAVELDTLRRADALVVIARSVDDLEETLRLKQTSLATIREIEATLKRGVKAEQWR